LEEFPLATYTQYQTRQSGFGDLSTAPSVCVCVSYGYVCYTIGDWCVYVRERIVTAPRESVSIISPFFILLKSNKRERETPENSTGE
jgi:hypothetical protein